MKQSLEFYDERAREAALAAKEAVLENVRDRNLRAEKTWLQLANQARRGQKRREDAQRAREEAAGEQT